MGRTAGTISVWRHCAAAQFQHRNVQNPRCPSDLNKQRRYLGLNKELLGLVTSLQNELSRFIT
ncbi:hypothetical protein B0T21DRAFT_361899 [Apiosordaria backusii]|uniref:Uncharacterized protein n=1 Tax=Apiosordaria backusii TaxID=314023 RepID=A0AA40BRH3_9PEZI|nr:hypothetical protein B0T21DRAFT_361899 [Apiosordaria backusii]